MSDVVFNVSAEIMVMVGSTSTNAVNEIMSVTSMIGSNLDLKRRERGRL